MANLKQKLNQLNMSSSVRCRSKLHNEEADDSTQQQKSKLLYNSSQASVTAATSYLARGGGGASGAEKSGYQFRPNSNISNLLDSKTNLDRNKTNMTDLTRFS